MNKIICTKCGDIAAEGPAEKSMGIITCEKCKKQIIWKCDGIKIVIK